MSHARLQRGQYAHHSKASNATERHASNIETDVVAMLAKPLMPPKNATWPKHEGGMLVIVGKHKEVDELLKLRADATEQASESRPNSERAEPPCPRPCQANPSPGLRPGMGSTGQDMGMGAA